MKPAEFEAQNIVLGKGQPEYMELPALKCDNAEGTVWSCWELDDADIADLIKHRKLWVGQMTFGNLFHPQMLTTMMPLEVSVATHKARQPKTFGSSVKGIFSNVKNPPVVPGDKPRG